MTELEMDSSASKFISSLVKSLQIICNGHVDFSESIELVGHINVRIDHKFKFDYIVDEHVSKEREDCSTTFLSNSYHSVPPAQVPVRDDNVHQQHDLGFSGLSGGRHKPHLSKSNSDVSLKEGCKSESSSQKYAVNVGSLKEQGVSQSPLVFKLEDNEDSIECMMLPTAPDDCEAVEEGNGPDAPSSGLCGSKEDSIGEIKTRKRKKTDDQDTIGSRETKVQAVPHAGARQMLSTDNQHESLKAHFNNFSDSELSIESQNQNMFTPTWEPGVSTSVHLQAASLICKFCRNVWDSQEGYYRHMCVVHKYVSCQQCSRLCPTTSALRSHMNREHTPKWVCSICRKTFHCKINYIGHMNMHSGNKPYACINCGKLFAYQQSKHAHEKICPSTPTPC